MLMVLAMTRGIVYALLVLTPTMLGSNRTLIWATNSLVISLTTTLFCATELARGSFSRFNWRLPLLVVFGILLLTSWMLIQALPGTPGFLHHPIWREMGIEGAISANPSQTFATLTWCIALLIFVPAVRIGLDARHSLFALNLMLFTAVAVASFGLINETYDLGTIGLLPKSAYSGWLTGTFVNRNTAATFLALNLTIATTLLTREVFNHSTDESPSGLKLLEGLISLKALYLAFCAILLAALILTGSRGGTIAAFLGSLSALTMQYAKRPNRRRALVPVLSLVGAGILACCLVASAFYVRAGESDTSMAVRVDLYREAIKAVTDRPLLGHGAGTYSSIEPLYHSAGTPSELAWSNAHSTILEAFACLGIPATLFALIIVVYALGSLAKAWRSGSPDTICTVSCLASAIAIAVHALVDFSLEIQAIALYSACLLGLATGETMRFQRKTASSH